MTGIASELHRVYPSRAEYEIGGNRRLESTTQARLTDSGDSGSFKVAGAARHVVGLELPKSSKSMSLLL